MDGQDPLFSSMGSGYLDTSVLVPYYCPEVFTSVAQRIVAVIERPVISYLTEVEFTSALSLKIRTGQIDEQTAHTSNELFQFHIADGYFSVLDVRQPVFQLAREWIQYFNSPLRTLDALHLASAHLAQIEMVTADKNLDKAASILGVQCRLIR